MLVTILEIVVFMVAAAVLGLLLGWVLRGSMGSEQAELARTRSQLRALKKTLREQQAASKAEVASSRITSNTQKTADNSKTPEKPAVEAKKESTAEPVSSQDTPKKPATSSKAAEQKAVSKKPAATKAAAKATPAKSKSTAKAASKASTKSKSSRSKRKSLAERQADQEIGKLAFAEVVARIGAPGAGDSEDNLTKIYGVGKRYAQMLNELGLYRYQQIAALKKADLKTLAAALGVLDDRIEQEDWVSSAKALLKEQESKAAK